MIVGLGDRAQRGSGIDAGVVHQDVGGAERFLRGVEEGFYVRGLGYVGSYGYGFAARRGDFIHHFLGSGGAAGIVHHNLCALGCQMFRYGCSDAFRSARDHRYLVV